MQPPAMQPVDLLYIAPHLDDAVLSCGGQIAETVWAGKTVWIVTVMAGDPPPAPDASASALVDELHARWQLAGDAVAGRRAEDLEACALLGATPQHLSIPDCIYRHDGNRYLYRANEEIFGPVHPAEAPLIRRIAGKLARLPPANQRFVPLGVGHHVDHLLARAAAEIAWDTARLTYYEEYPYAEAQGATARALAENPPAANLKWAAQSIPLSAQALRVKGQAVAAYRSQISTFFADTDEIQARIESFAAARGGERVWIRQAFAQSYI